MFNPIHDPGRVAVPDVGLDELLQLKGIGLKEHRSPFYVVSVEWMGDYPVVLIVVQVGAGVQPNVFFLYCLIEIFEEALIRPSLVRWVEGFGRAFFEAGYDNGVILGKFCLLPLLQFDKNGRFAPVLIPSGQDKVDALRGLRQVVFDGDAGIMGDLQVIEHPVHVLQRVHPRLHLCFASSSSCGRLEGVEDDAVNVVRHHIIVESCFGGRINDQCWPLRLG